MLKYGTHMGVWRLLCLIWAGFGSIIAWLEMKLYREQSEYHAEALSPTVLSGMPTWTSRYPVSRSVLTGDIRLSMLEAIAVSLTVTDPSIDTNTGSYDNLRLARSWLDECINDHEGCSPYHGGQVTLPTRVLDVSSQDVRLHISTDEVASYAILSHCWGSHRIITTIEENLKPRCSNIPFNELSKTFQDAIVVTRALGLMYLWIDSLCIIQDSAHDWEIESSKMGKYYASACVTIAAIDAKDGSIGCFVKRNPLSLQPCRLNIQLHGIDEKVAVITSQVPNHKSRTGELNRNPRFMSSLDSRAWCLQERIMSPRILCFGWQEMSWICTSRRIFEGLIKEDTTITTPLQTDCFRTLHDLQTLVNTHGPQCKHNIWFDIVEQYTQRYLTFTSDTLPGLSGLASEIQALNHDKYLAGIWKRDLARGLVWRTPSQIIMKQRLLDQIQSDELRQIPFAKRSAEYRAPSWSWASVDNGFVNWDHVREFMTVDGEAVVGVEGDADRHSETCFELVESSIDLQGQNPFGQVRDGSLRVRGLLKRADVWAWEDGVEGRYVDDPNVIDPETRELIGRVDADDGDWVECPVWCLPILRDVRNDEDENTRPETFCLALIPVGLYKQCFTRIGVAVIGDRDWFAQCERIEVTII